MIDTLRVKKLLPEAILPTRAHPDDAGLDLYAVEPVLIKPGERVQVSTGLAFAVPVGYVGLVWDKSGVAFNLGLTCLAGVLDSQYRGDLLVVLLNIGNEEVEIKQGQKIAQLLIQKVELSRVEEVLELEDTVRGKGGFGSTGI